MSFGTTEARRAFRTIGFRLTLWGAGFTLGVCFLVCAVLYAGVSISLRREVDGFLEGEMQEFMAVLDEYPDDFPAAERVIRQYYGSRDRGDLTFRLLDTDGSVLLSSDPSGLLLPPRESVRPLNEPAPKSWFHTLNVTPSGYPVRIISRTVEGPHGTPYTAQVAYLLDHVTDSLATLRGICVGALVLASAFAFIGGWFLARRALTPVRRMTVSARHISIGGSRDRLPRSHTGDELDDLAQTLNDMLDRGEQYIRLLRQFTSDASHELRSPLAALRGSAEVALTRERSAPELRVVLEESIEQYDRLIRIAEDLLLLAHIDAGQDIFRREPVRLDAAIDDVVDLYAPFAADSGLELAFVERVDVSVEGDGGRLRQLVANLIDNAIKYTNAPGHIDLSLTSANGHACIKVSDTGTGIPAENLPRIFDRFYRVDRARTLQRSGGAGLGLSICRSITEAHKGFIDIQSSVGQGTLVTVTLPVKAEIS